MKPSVAMVTLLVSILLATVAVPMHCRAEPGRLVITGTGSSIAVMQLMAAAFKARHPDIDLQVLPSIGSSGGIKAVQAGKIDIGLSSRQLKPEERSRDLVVEAYGRTAFLFAVPSDTPVTGISLREIEDVYSGKRTAWGPGLPLRLVLRPQNDAYTLYLGTISPGLKAAAERSYSIPGLFVGATDQDAAVQIERIPGGFGVTSACLVAAEKRKLRGLAVDGRLPTLTNVRSGAYPYTMTMHLVYSVSSNNPAVAEFVRFVFSPQGRKILTRTEHVAIPRDSGR